MFASVRLRGKPDHTEVWQVISQGRELCTQALPNRAILGRRIGDTIDWQHLLQHPRDKLFNAPVTLPGSHSQHTQVHSSWHRAGRRVILLVHNLQEEIQLNWVSAKQLLQDGARR
jgi:hypothetical protein